MNGIKRMGKSELQDINKSSQPFKIVGRLVLSYNDDKFETKEELFEKAMIKSYKPDNVVYSDYIESDDKAIYMYYQENLCLGQIIIRSNWNRYAFIESIDVSDKHRNQGIGRKLVDQAVNWAKSKNLKGLMLETQNNNLSACRFYQKYGFTIGGFDKYLYKNLESSEYAIFWYLDFNLSLS